MANMKIKLEILTIEKPFFNDEVDQVDFGDFGVLAFHEPFHRIIKDGVMTVFNNGKKLVFELKGASAHMNNRNELTILTQGIT